MGCTSSNNTGVKNLMNAKQIAEYKAKITDETEKTNFDEKHLKEKAEIEDLWAQTEEQKKGMIAAFKNKQ